MARDQFLKEGIRKELLDLERRVNIPLKVLCIPVTDLNGL